MPDLSDIPLTFTYKGSTYHATLEPVKGAAAPTWHLMIDKIYEGQLVFTRNGFQFTSQTGKFQELGEWFGEVVVAANQ